MKLIVEVTTRDDKVKKYECVDFPMFTDRFITLYLPNFVREIIPLETIAAIRHFFEV